jgi:tetratricopeptide (TPR) repeat protein
VRPSGDRSQLFTLGLAASWVLCVALPLTISVLLERSARGLPLLGVAVWVVLLRVARRLTPTARCDRLLLYGDYAQALALCEQELAVASPAAWVGTRRIAWMNRRANALLRSGHLSAALVAALEALDARPDPETVANCAECLLWLNRYPEANTAARIALSLTRERSVSANAVLAHILLAEGRPAEAQALAQAGMADIEALLPFVQPAHHVALLAALCRAERTLDDITHARRHLAALQQAARRDPMLQAQAMLEEADGLATGSGEDRVQALDLLAHAIQLAPHYVCWFLAQPHTLLELRDEPQLASLAARARANWLVACGSMGAPEAGAPPATFVAVELSAAQARGYVRPAPYASWRALVVQVLALAGTLTLLIWWTWRFFLVGA